MSEAAPFRYAKADESPGFLLWKLTALWRGELTRLLDGYGITQTQYAILASLRWFEAQGEPPTQTHLAEHTKTDKMTLSKALRGLEVQGLVKRTKSREDARAVGVRFSPKGRSLVQKAVVTVEGADEAFFGKLPGPELESYKALTRTLIAGNGH